MRIIKTKSVKKIKGEKLSPSTVGSKGPGPIDPTVDGGRPSPKFFSGSHPYTAFPRCLNLTAYGARPPKLFLNNSSTGSA